jgi:site-specific DNA-cytosine methylase
MPKAPSRDQEVKTEKSQDKSTPQHPPKTAPVRKLAVKAMPRPPAADGAPRNAKPSEVVLLSMFDGIGTAETAMETMGMAPAYTYRWETDPACIAVVRKHTKRGSNRGDLSLDDPKDLAKDIQKWFRPDRRTILVAAGPPCPDFSRITGNAEGRTGPEGCKFVDFVAFLEELETILGDFHFRILVENVYMAENEVTFFSQRLKAFPISVDAADFGVISRPRLFWTRVDWTVAKDHPVTKKPLKWGKDGKRWRLLMDVEQQDLAGIETEGSKFPDKVANRQGVMACLTTPAPTAAGRAAPASMRSKMQPMTKQRWLSDGRRFAPWHYEVDHLMTDAQGELHVPSAVTKEGMHMFEPGFTEADGVTDTDRHHEIPGIGLASNR